jgi:cysteine-rich repeat protein
MANLARVVVFAVTVVAIMPASAAVPANTCAGAKLGATGVKCSAKVKCLSAAASHGTAADPACLSRAEDRFANAFAKAASKGGCATTGDAATIEAKVDAHVDDLRDEIWSDEPTENRCAAGKLGAAGKNCVCKLQCAAKAVRRGVTVDAVCMQRCEERFVSTFARREGKGGCTTTGDAATIEIKVDAFVADAFTEIQPAPTTTTTIPAVCGNGSVEGGEECDDGGMIPDDGCDTDCHLESVNPAVCAGVPAVAGTGLDATLVAEGLVEPVHVAGPRLDPSRVFIVEKRGRIVVVKNGTLLGAPFLDIESIVRSSGFEEGLFSVAFHPDYELNRRFFVYYVNNQSNLVIARYEADLGNPDVADEASAHIVRTIPHPDSENHNGGNLNFGPDGFLYAATGDGGTGGANAQDDASLLGKLLRIDVATDAVTTWAKGLRNPFRFSFDRATGDIYIGDVGQLRWEEINFVAGNPMGVNYGWSIMEARHCHEPAVGCATAGLTLPVLEYCNLGYADAACDDFQPDKGSAVIGGFVYRGCAMPDVRGDYFYSDTYSERIHTFRGVSGGDAQSVMDRTADLDPPGARSIDAITSFGEDARGELYIADFVHGEVFKIIPGS